MPAKITKRTVDALVAENGKEVVLWDTEVKGFGIRVRAGGAKTYIVHYRAGTGRGAPIRKMTIGPHGSPWTPDTARTEARRVLGMVENGIDPAAEKQAGKKAETMADLCAKFMTEHVEAKRKGRTAEEYRRLVDKIILPVLGKKKAKDVTRQDVARLHNKNRVTPYQANRVLAVLSKLFNLAEVWGIRADSSNPCHHIEKFKEVQRERMLSADELAALGDALTAYDGSLYATAAIKLLVFTGARLQEVLGLRWDWIDIEHGVAHLPDSKTGAKMLQLPPPALAVLADLPRIEKNPFVIVGAKTGACLVNLEKPWRAIRKAATVNMWKTNGSEDLIALIKRLEQTAATEERPMPTFEEIEAAANEADISLPVGLSNVRLHDLRHAFASVAASSGMGLPIIGKMLGHTQAQTTQRYAHLSADPVAAAAASVAGKIEAAMNSGASGGKVIPLPRKSGGGH